MTARGSLFQFRQRVLFRDDFTPAVDAKTYALERAHDLLVAALKDDERRRWWARPNRLWVGRTTHAVRLIERALDGE